MSWPTVSLGKDLAKLGSGITPRGGDSVYVDEGTALIRSQNVYNNQFHKGGLAYINTQQADVMKGVTVCEGDVLLNITGDSVARCCIVPIDILPARVNQHVMIIRPKMDAFDPAYLAYQLTGPFFQSTLLSIAGSGGTRKALTKAMIERLEMPKPGIDQQRRIASILSAYDDLIENNRRRIGLLEESARQLYKEWFVRFRFPGHEHVKVIDGVPEGWERRPFPDVVDFKEGPGLRNFQYRSEGLPFLNIRTLGNDEIDLSKTQFLDPNEVESRYQHFLVEENDHVVSSSGTLGRVATVRKCHLPLCLNTSIIRMRPKAKIGVWTLKAYLCHGDFLDQATARATGAA